MFEKAFRDTKHKIKKLIRNYKIINRKIVLLSLCFISFPLLLFSQHEGFNFNLGISKIGNKFSNGESLGIGYFHEYNLKSNFSILAGGVFEYRSFRNKGTSFHGRFEDFYTEYKYKEIPRVFYFDIPLQLVYSYKKLHLGLGYKFSIYIGNQYNRKLSHMTYYNNGQVDEMKFSESQIIQNTIIIDPWIFNKEKYCWMDHGYILSLGYSFSPKWDITINYYAGLSDILPQYFRYKDLKFKQFYVSFRTFLPGN